jgi:hypothetical protein
MPARAGASRFGDGQSTLDARISQQGDSIVSELHGRYYEQAVRKNVFFSLGVAQATSVAGTAMIGNLVWNPPDSGVNLALNKWTSHILATQAALTSVGLCAGYQTTSPTTVTVATAAGSTFLQLTGATNAVFLPGKAKAFTVATVLLAPVTFINLHHNTAAIAITGEDVISGDLEGLFVVPPGGFVAFATVGAAAAASGHTSFLSWEEVPTL